MIINPVEIPSQEQISTKKKYFVDDIAPIAIQKINIYSYSVLFFTEEACSELTKYFQIQLIVEDADSRRFLESLDIFTGNYMPLAEISTKELYQSRIREANNSKIYSTDFQIEKSKDIKRYYHSTAIYKSGKSYEFLDLYMPTNIYYPFLIYLNDFLKLKDSVDVIRNPLYTKMKVVDISKVTLDGTYKDGDTYHSHYSLVGGHYIYGINVTTSECSGKEMRKPLEKVTFDTLYGDSYELEYYTERRKDYCILFSDVKNGKWYDTYIFRINKELLTEDTEIFIREGVNA
jgi:hypothetical protein